MYNDSYIVLVVIIVLAIIALIVGACAVVASMAKKRGRNVVGWVLLSFLSFPIAIVLMLCLGETEERRKERLEEEAFMFWKVWDDYFNSNKEAPKDKGSKQEIDLQKNANPGMSINDMYKKVSHKGSNL